MKRRLGKRFMITLTKKELAAYAKQGSARMKPLADSGKSFSSLKTSVRKAEE